VAKQARLDLLINVALSGLREAEKLRQALDNLGKVRSFQQLSQQLTKTEQELQRAKQRFTELRQQIRATQAPSTQLKAEFEKASQTVQQLSQRYNRLKSQLGELRSSLQQAGISTRSLADAERLLTQETQRLEQTLRRTSALDAYKRMLNVKPFRQVQAEIQRLNQAYKELERGFRRGEVTSFELAKAKVNLRKRVSELSREYRVLHKEQTQVLDSFKGLIAAYASYQGLVQLKQHVQEAVQAYVRFDDAIRSVAAVARASEEDFQRLAQTAREMGRNTRYSATEAAEGMRYLAMAGFDVNQTISAIPTVLNLAAAGMMDLGQASDIVTNIMTQFNMSISELPHAADLLTAAFTQSNTSLTELGYAFSYVGPVAKSAGQTLEETTAVLMALANAGYRGERAGTTLRQALVRLIKPTAEGAAVLEKYGVAVRDTAGRMRPLIDILLDLRRAGISAEDTVRLFGMIAGPGMSAVLQQGEDALVSYREKLQDVEGTAQKVAQFQEAGLGGALRRLKAQFEEYQIAIGEAIKHDGVLIDSLSDLVGWLERNREQIAQLIVQLSHYAATLLRLAQSAGDFVIKHKELVLTLVEVAAKLYILNKAWALFKTTSMTFSAAKAVAELRGMHTALALVEGSLKAVRAASLPLLALWMGWELGKAIKEIYDLSQANKQLKQAEQDGYLAAIKLKTALETFGESVGVQITTIKELDQLITNGTLVWSQSMGSWVASVQDAQGAVLSLTDLHKRLDQVLLDHKTTLESQRNAVFENYKQEEQIFNKKLELYAQDANTFSQLMSLRQQLLEMTNSRALEQLSTYTVRSKQAEAEILSAKQQIWQQSINEYRAFIDFLVQEEQRRRQAVELIEQEIQRARMTTEQFIRELRRQTMTEEEAYRDRSLEAEEKISAMRKALAEGDLKSARRYYNEALSAIRRISQGIQDEALKQEARNQQIELATRLQQTYISALEKEKKKHSEIADAAAQAKQTVEERIREIQQQLEEITARKQELKIAVQLEQEATKEQAQQLRNYLDSLFQEIKVNIKLYDEAVREQAQILHRDLETELAENPIRAALALGSEDLPSQVGEVRASLSRFFEEAPIAVATSLDTQSIYQSMEQVQQELGEKFNVTGTASLDTSPILQAAQAARQQVEGTLTGITTHSQHRVFDNASQVLQALDSLQGRDTSSTHTIYVRRVEARALGGQIDPAAFSRKRGYLPGYGSADSVPALLMPGEFVIRKEAVRKYGLRLFQLLNFGQFPREALPKFATGGLVDYFRHNLRKYPFNPAQVQEQVILEKDYFSENLWKRLFSEALREFRTTDSFKPLVEEVKKAQSLPEDERRQYLQDLVAHKDLKQLLGTEGQKLLRRYTSLLAAKASRIKAPEVLPQTLVSAGVIESQELDRFSRSLVAAVAATNALRAELETYKLKIRTTVPYQPRELSIPYSFKAVLPPFVLTKPFQVFGQNPRRAFDVGNVANFLTVIDAWTNLFKPETVSSGGGRLWTWTDAGLGREYGPLFKEASKHLVTFPLTYAVNHTEQVLAAIKRRQAELEQTSRELSKKTEEYFDRAGELWNRVPQSFERDQVNRTAEAMSAYFRKAYDYLKQEKRVEAELRSLRSLTEPIAAIQRQREVQQIVVRPPGWDAWDPSTEGQLRQLYGRFFPYKSPWLSAEPFLARQDRAQSALAKSVAGARFDLDFPAIFRGVPIQKFHTGGFVASFSGLSQVPSLLQSGEFVIRKEAVDRYGLGLLSRLNSLQIPRFATGGEVKSLEFPNLGRVVIQINGKQMPVYAESDVAKELVKQLQSLAEVS